MKAKKFFILSLLSCGLVLASCGGNLAPSGGGGGDPGGGGGSSEDKEKEDIAWSTYSKAGQTSYGYYKIEETGYYVISKDADMAIASIVNDSQLSYKKDGLKFEVQKGLNSYAYYDIKEGATSTLFADGYECDEYLPTDNHGYTLTENTTCCYPFDPAIIAISRIYIHTTELKIHLFEAQYITLTDNDVTLYYEDTAANYSVCFQMDRTYKRFKYVSESNGDNYQSYQFSYEEQSITLPEVTPPGPVVITVSLSEAYANTRALLSNYTNANYTFNYTNVRKFDDELMHGHKNFVFNGNKANMTIYGEDDNNNPVNESEDAFLEVYTGEDGYRKVNAYAKYHGVYVYIPAIHSSNIYLPSDYFDSAFTSCDLTSFTELRENYYTATIGTNNYAIEVEGNYIKSFVKDTENFKYGNYCHYFELKNVGTSTFVPFEGDYITGEQFVETAIAPLAQSFAYTVSSMYGTETYDGYKVQVDKSYENKEVVRIIDKSNNDTILVHDQEANKRYSYTKNSNDTYTKKEISESSYLDLGKLYFSKAKSGVATLLNKTYQGIKANLGSGILVQHYNFTQGLLYQLTLDDYDYFLYTDDADVPNQKLKELPSFCSYYENVSYNCKDLQYGIHVEIPA